MFATPAISISLDDNIIVKHLIMPYLCMVADFHLFNVQPWVRLSIDFLDIQLYYKIKDKVQEILTLFE